jgi:hypothetical protein
VSLSVKIVVQSQKWEISDRVGTNFYNVIRYATLHIYSQYFRNLFNAAVNVPIYLVIPSAGSEFVQEIASYEIVRGVVID